MLFEILDEITKENYNRLLRENEEFKGLELPDRVLMAQLETVRHYDTWAQMLEQSLVDTMDRIEYNFMELFRGYDLRKMLPYPNTEEKIVQLFLANFKNVEVATNWEEEEPDLQAYIQRMISKYYLFLITIHANTSEHVRPGIVKAFADFIKAFEDTKKSDLGEYVKSFEAKRKEL